jgi:ketosteroid isomerase-like protein
MTLKFLLIVTASACLSLTAAAQQSGALIGTYNVVKEEVTLNAEEWMNAYNAGDVEKLAAFYSKDADYISPHVPGLLIHGREAITQNFQRGIAGGGHVDSIVVQRSSYSGDLAYMVCAYQATNSGVTVRGKNVLVLKRAGDKWLIVTHASIIKD